MWIHWGPAVRTTDAEVDSLIGTDKWISTDGESRKRGNGTGTDTAISTTDTEADSLIRIQKVRISESVRMLNRVRGVPVTLLVPIPGPQCIEQSSPRLPHHSSRQIILTVKLSWPSYILEKCVKFKNVICLRIRAEAVNVCLIIRTIQEFNRILIFAWHAVFTALVLAFQWACNPSNTTRTTRTVTSSWSSHCLHQTEKSIRTRWYATIHWQTPTFTLCCD